MFTDAVSRAVLASAPEGLFVFDREGRIVFVNSQIEELFGYAPGELLGQSLEVLLPVLFWEMRERQSEVTAPALGLPTERSALEQIGYRKDHAEILVQLSLSHVDAHDRALACCVVRKISAPEQQNQTLNELNDQFRQMVENNHDILTIRDSDGRVRYTSPSVQGILGYKQEEMIGSTGFELIHPEDRSTVENAMNGFWKNPGAKGSIQYRAKHANGTWVSLEVVAYNLLDHPGIRGVVINGRDISQRKQEEAGKDQMIAELQQTIAGVKTLTGVLSICASCKKIQEGDKWRQIEAYIRDRSQVEFTHTMCPECAELWYPEHCQR
jgi:PAS domain S-box-containing protein